MGKGKLSIQIGAYCYAHWHFLLFYMILPHMTPPPHFSSAYRLLSHHGDPNLQTSNDLHDDHQTPDPDIFSRDHIMMVTL